MYLKFLQSFLAIASRQPKDIAIVDGNRSVSYGDLAAQVIGLAEEIDKRVSSDRPVAVLMPKTIEAVASVLAILMSGRCYVPMDPALPRSRKVDILEDSKAGLVLIKDSALETGVSSLAANAKCHVVDLSKRASLQSIVLAPLEQGRDKPAAVLYTSGSTSKPKGVWLSRNAVGVFVDWAASYFGFSASDRVASHAPLGFDISILDLFTSFATGATVYLVPETQLVNGRYLHKFLRDQEITIWQSVPAPLIAIAREADGKNLHPNGPIPALPDDMKLPALRHIMSTGEPISTFALATLAGMAPRVRFHNIYGCTETNDSFVFSCRPEEIEFGSQLPLGRALPHVDYRIVDDQLGDVMMGEPGELLVSSPTNFIGYTDPAKTETASVYLEGKRFYRSRDRVVQDYEGVLHFISRIDDTTKLRGYRIDLREVENCLTQLPGVEEAVAIAIDSPEKGKSLIGILSGPGSEKLSFIQLKKHCASILPRQAIPERFDVSNAPLPRNSNGKIDRRAAANNYAARLEKAH